jgi:hypothetical protein
MSKNDLSRRALIAGAAALPVTVPPITAATAENNSDADQDEDEEDGYEANATAPTYVGTPAARGGVA